MNILLYCLVAAVGYLLGSLNFGVLISRLFYHDDVRRYGSGNAGSTNILRVYGWGAAAAVFAGDVLKGTGSALLGLLLLGEEGCFLGGACALIGHMFPIYFRFRGGKGIATAAGFIAVFNYRQLLLILAVFLIGVLVTRIISVGSIAAAVSYPVAIWITDGRPVVILSGALLAALVIFMHRANLVRLLRGEEKRMNFSRKKTPPSN